MKTLTEQTVELGTLELSIEDMKQAIADYLQKLDYRAIDIPLDHNISVEVLRTVKAAKTVKNDKAPKFKRQNIGIYGAIRDFFESERKKGTKRMKFEELFPLVKLEYPMVTEDRLNMYLYDKTQFPGIKYENKMIYL